MGNIIQEQRDDKVLLVMIPIYVYTEGHKDNQENSSWNIWMEEHYPHLVDIGGEDIMSVISDPEDYELAELYWNKKIQNVTANETISELLYKYRHELEFRFAL